MAGISRDGQGRDGSAGQITAVQGRVGHCRADRAVHGSVRQGREGHGRVGHGKAFQGRARQRNER
jgi:hypothetical protein